MDESGLKPKLQKLGLRQSELARLLDVSSRTVNLWATGAQPLPGSTSAYLRLLEAAEPAVREAEFERLHDRSKYLREGIYAVAYRSAASDEDGRGIAVLRSGKLSGSDTEGILFTGSYRHDRAKGCNWIHLRLGAARFDGAGIGAEIGVPEAGSIETSFALPATQPVSSGSAVIAGEVYEIELRLLGPLPD